MVAIARLVSLVSVRRHRHAASAVLTSFSMVSIIAVAIAILTLAILPSPLPTSAMAVAADDGGRSATGLVDARLVGASAAARLFLANSHH